MNHVKSRLQSLGLLDRTYANASDDDLQAAVDALDDEHRDALDEVLDGSTDPASIRAAVTKGRLDGTMESISLVLTDACLADCIDELGDAADHPSSDQLREVLPTMVERHGLAITQMMLASTVLGEAPAAAIIRDLLKHDDLVKLPPAEDKPAPARLDTSKHTTEEKAALKEKRRELRKKKQEEARAKREQAARARGRS